MKNFLEIDHASKHLGIFASKLVSLLGWKAQPTSNVGGVGTPPYVANSTQLQGKKNSLTETNLFTHSPIHLFTLKRAAFTLAEVLITLGIIGVVAALTLPAVITKYQKKQTATQLKKVYTTLSQAIEHAKADYGDVSTWGLGEAYGTPTTSANGQKLVRVLAKIYTSISYKGTRYRLYIC